MSDIFNLFEGCDFKGKRYIACKTGFIQSMTLWIALHEMTPRLFEERELTREEWKAIVLDYPYDTQGCICKPCRYKRWYGK